MRKLIALLLIVIPGFRQLNCQNSNPLILNNNVADSDIKSVRIFREGWNLSYPVIRLNSEEKLVLDFDRLGDQTGDYYYTIIHCTKDWERSDIFEGTYLEGFPENPVENYRYSFNTTVKYVHYKLTFPNDRINVKISGNYVISVYPADEPGKPVITQRFIITENAASIKVDAHRPKMTSDNNSSQQIDFSVTYQGLNITDPYSNIYACILQNGRWDNAKLNLKPDFLGNNELKYNSLSDKNIFAGGNEFRYFDIKSIRYQSEFVRKIDFLVSGYNVYLHPSENREFKPYFYWQDFNGRYLIAFQEGKYPDIDADYVRVWFTLPSKYQVTGGKMYVSGALTNWLFNDENLMVYNPESQAYECSLLLKQGWYNYEYVFTADKMPVTVASKFEGSHYETENDYTIIVYYRNPRERYDRVIGTVTTNTLNRMSD